MVVKAYRFAAQKHKGQYRRFTGEEYFVHPVAVSKIVEDMTKDDVLIQVALLHDIVEDTDTTLEEVKELFGEDVGELVDQLTETTEKRDGLSKVEYLSKEMAEMSPAALTVKLADRLDNIQCLKNDYADKKFPSFAEWYYRQTINIMGNIGVEGMNEVQSILGGMIAIDLMYAKIKHGWE